MGDMADYYLDMELERHLSDYFGDDDEDSDRPAKCRYCRAAIRFEKTHTGWRIYNYATGTPHACARPVDPSEFAPIDDGADLI